MLERNLTQIPRRLPRLLDNKCIYIYSSSEFGSKSFYATSLGRSAYNCLGVGGGGGLRGASGFGKRAFFKKTEPGYFFFFQNLGGGGGGGGGFFSCVQILCTSFVLSSVIVTPPSKLPVLL